MSIGKIQPTPFTHATNNVVLYNHIVLPHGIIVLGLIFQLQLNNCMKQTNITYI